MADVKLSVKDSVSPTCVSYCSIIGPCVLWYIPGVSLTVSETAVHLGHHMSTKDKEFTVNAAKNSFGRSFNLFISDYGHIYSFLKKIAV